MKLSFLELVRLLWRAQDWEADTSSVFEQSIRHKTRDIQFYWDFPSCFYDDTGGEKIYAAGPFSYLFISTVLVPRVRRFVFEGENHE